MGGCGGGGLFSILYTNMIIETGGRSDLFTEVS